MAELHIIGQISHAKGFDVADLFCKWAVVVGDDWRLLEGVSEGQTQVDTPSDGNITVWSHPLDLHYATKSVVGWPKVHFQCWAQDSLGRSSFVGYGFCHIPPTPGSYEIPCSTWAPAGSTYEQLSSHFFGASANLLSDDIVYSGDDRFKMRTLSGGTVVIKLNIIAKDFQRHGVLLGTTM